MTTASVTPTPTNSKTDKWRYVAGFMAFAVLNGVAFFGTMSVLVPAATAR